MARREVLLPVIVKSGISSCVSLLDFCSRRALAALVIAMVVGVAVPVHGQNDEPALILVLAIDQLRRRTLYFRFLNAEKNLSEGGEPVDSNAIAASPEKILAAREKLAYIYRAVDELPFKVKQAFLLHRHRGMSYQEIATEMEVSVSSVEKYILEALKHCRRQLANYYPPGNDGEIE